MNLTLRVLLLLIIIPPLIYFVTPLFLIPVLFITGQENSWFGVLLATMLATISAVPLARFILRVRVDATAKGRRTAVRMGAIIAGSIGILVGFVAAEVYMPDNEQNVLMSFFITGPLGFVLGALGGLLYWMMRKVK